MLARSLLSMVSPGGERARLSIMIFHRVLPERDPLWPSEITRREFDSLCGWLRQWCNVLPLDQAVRALRSGALPTRAVALTFDDGYADNHDQALPVLRKHGLTATIFVASGFLDGGRMWNDTLIEAVRHCREQTLDLRGTAAASLGSLPLESIAQRRAAIGKLLSAIKYLPQAQRDSWVAAVALRAGSALPDNLMMSSGQIRSLHEQGVTIGAHTMDHPIMRGLDTLKAAAEIEKGRRVLSQITGKPISLFAYPNGVPDVDYDASTVNVVRQLGFEAAVSTAWRAARRSDDMLQLPRYTPWERTKGRFAMRLWHTLATT